MQIEDIIRMRESDVQAKHEQVEGEQEALVREIKRLINKITLQPSTRSNKTLQLVINVLKTD